MPRNWAILISFTLLSACSAFTAPKEKPVITDKVGLKLFSSDETTVFTLTPERRTVIVVSKDPENQYNSPDSKTFRPLQFCAEPPPDVAEGLVSSLRAVAEATVKNAASETDVSAAAELTKSLSTSVSNLFYRSQGVQVLRDGLFSLCQAYINGIISEQDYLSLYKTLLQTSSTLIAAEIPTAQTQKALDAAQRAESAKTSAEAAAEGARTAQSAAESLAARMERELADIRKIRTQSEPSK